MPIKLIEPTIDLDVVFVSKIRTYLACRRKYYWTYIRNLEGKGLYIPFFVGSAFHKGVELFFRGYAPKKVLRLVSEYMDEYLGKYFVRPENQGKIEVQKGIVLGMLRAYMRYFASERDEYEIVALEQSYAFRMDYPPIDFVGTVDFLMKRGKKNWLRDYKALSQINEDRIESLPMDLQIQCYPKLVMEAAGIKLTGMAYMMMKKPGIRQRQGETFDEFIERVEEGYLEEPDKFFHEEELYFQPKHMKLAFRDFTMISEELFALHNVMSEEQIMDPQNWARDSGACFNYNTRCEFWNLCRYGEDISRLKMYKEREGTERGEIIRAENKPKEKSPYGIDHKIEVKEKTVRRSAKKKRVIRRKKKLISSTNPKRKVKSGR